MSLLIPTHALPPLSYRIPEHLTGKVRVGTAVVVPLSGYSRLGVVVETPDNRRSPESSPPSLKDILDVVANLSVDEGLAGLCRWAAWAAAVPLAGVLRSALPPGLAVDTYRVREPKPRWPWKRGDVVGRLALSRRLGKEGLKAAEAEGRVWLFPTRPARKTAEWAVIPAGSDPDLSRAPRQKELFEALVRSGSECASADLLRDIEARRETLRGLVRRGAVRLEERPEASPVSATRGTDGGWRSRAFGDICGVPVRRVIESKDAWVWRTPPGEWPAVATELAEAAAGRWEQTLILVPEIEQAERLVSLLRDRLPPGVTVAPYHSGLGEARVLVYDAAREGAVDVLVGTRPSIFMPLTRLGAVCVLDEPNEAHRAGPGYEGVPIHVRDLALERGRQQGAAVLFLSPAPSVQLYAPEYGVRELETREPDHWPVTRIVDMGGTGATLSPALVKACQENLAAGERTGVLVNRLGHATLVSCARCANPLSCPVCSQPLTLHGGSTTGVASCANCGYRTPAPQKCPHCGSGRLVTAGITVGRVREELSRLLNRPVGVQTAGHHENGDAGVVVGTPRYILGDTWGTVAVPDADSLLFGGDPGASERAFRLLYGCAGVCRQLIVQTRYPEHLTLRAALEGDYPAFARAELKARRSLGYPPYTHLAAIDLSGPQDRVEDAVESWLRPALDDAVELAGPAPRMRPGGPPTWRVLLRSRDRAAVSRGAASFAQEAARKRSGSHGLRGLEVQVYMDPEEV